MPVVAYMLLTSCWCHVHSKENQRWHGTLNDALAKSLCKFFGHHEPSFHNFPDHHFNPSSPPTIHHFSYHLTPGWPLVPYPHDPLQPVACLFTCFQFCWLNVSRATARLMPAKGAAKPERVVGWAAAEIMNIEYIINYWSCIQYCIPYHSNQLLSNIEYPMDCRWLEWVL